ncbi:(Fe-S)-binding protein [Mycolicibacterium fortuitum]|uniref:Heterodisulfide reductase-related iron-sulfur binding cluster n=4 Tax=Mycolicibacterium fortuitum TaxID=1766 RepID=A0AAE4VBK4_MYCFO|nr:heterodisulfide reductase-related iron-sulfur binding cluster [Mycolicibacterium fortuitum]MDO3240734.1 heterodisulfide reductase-related iron-sulfur binding cluster [Mycobacteroides abscessus subsp. abscessus]MCV7142043.1 4Fe-4S dicluster domain-containing protein [Mycolicibacterium fortuitum]MDV7192270.1 heterodisulfide reductase-related iron-sulfur binding cluster [Mycolicibacterium fortuitum]MDV7205001.1 heterodisulfide reductase-related iron-sulfur binding cluster [Mycolicibacterium for
MESLEHTLAVSRLILGLLATLVVLAFAGKRVLWLTKLISSGQKVGDERGRKDHLVTRFLNQNKEVFAQSKLLKWSIPGLAHFFTMWGFFVLATVYLEAYGVLFNPEFHIPLVGRWAVLGFLQDFFAVAVLAGIIVFAIIRILKNPEQLGRESRFYGSHNGGAWTILIMIFLVIATYAVFRGAAVNVLDEDFPYQSGAFFSDGMAALLAPLGHTANVWLETIALLAHLGVMLAFLLIVLHSKHLHIGLAPINVTFKRLPDGLGPLLPMEYKGEKIDFEDPAEDAVFGKGRIEDFTWKGNLDMATCTECGRCQSQCPAWNTGKPLSPKLVIMNLRDHLFAKAPYIIEGKPMPEEGSVDFAKLGDSLHGHGVPEDGFARIEGSGPEQALRPLVGTAEQGGVIDPDVLWSCTNCGACVEQCPVDIEHIDHIVDMRRYQVMVESEFPGELGVLFKNLETKGNPWGQNAKDRTNWIDEVDFDVPVYGEDVESFDGFEYLFWVGCAGAYEDRAKKTTKAVAELLAASGVKFLVLGTGETCTGDSARRSGNEFLFQQLAAQNVETINELFEGVETVDRKIIVTCPHCFNTIGREYPQLGANYTVVHHTQLLNRLVRDKKLVPVKSTGGPEVTYHDPCFLGRHNKVYEAPRELVEASGVTLKEMPRHADRGLCCGAGGARMWMEEHIGKRVNVERTEEAMDTASTIATGCPFCRVMITDGVDDVAAARNVEKAEVLDVAQLLLNSLDKSGITLPEKGTAAKESEKRAEARAEAEAKAAAAAPAPVVEEAAPAEAAPAAEAPAAPAAAPAPVKGLGMAGGAKRPGAKKAAAPAASAAPAEAPAAPAAPVKGLGIAGGAKRPGAKKAAPAASAAPAEAPAEAPAAPAAPAAPVKGLGLAAGAKRPGAKKAAAPAAPAAPAAEAPAAAPEAAEPAKPEPPVVGLGIAAGARRPGAKKAAKAAPAAPAPAAPAAEAAPEPAAEKPAEAPAEPAKPEPPVVGLGIKPGAKRPGKR